MLHTDFHTLVFQLSASLDALTDTAQLPVSVAVMSAGLDSNVIVVSSPYLPFCFNIVSLPDYNP